MPWSRKSSCRASVTWLALNASAPNRSAVSSGLNRNRFGSAATSPAATIDAASSTASGSAPESMSSVWMPDVASTDVVSSRSSRRATFAAGHLRGQHATQLRLEVGHREQVLPGRVGPDRDDLRHRRTLGDAVVLGLRVALV